MQKAIQKAEYRKAVDLILLIDKNEKTILTDITKTFDWTFKTTYNYVNFLIQKGLANMVKNKRVCDITLTDSGRKLVKSCLEITEKFK